MTPLYLALGGAFGTVARYYVADRIGAAMNSGAAGIFVVNVTGSFAIGLFLALGEDRFSWSHETRVLVAAGFLGGYTTFSTLAWQTFRLTEGREVGLAALNVVGSVVAGLLAVWAGAALARSV